MKTGISEIFLLPDGNIQITFCIYPECEDFMIITIDKRTAWEIADFCHEKLSYAAELKNKTND